jgi:MOSC domain-containing protein YiiM
MPPRLVSVNVVRAIIPDPRGDVGRTAIDKAPSSEPVDLLESGPAGDVVVDRKHHGGRDQAVYAYAREDQAWWEEELGRPLPPGTFGENLTTEGLDVTAAVIGERWRIDGVDGSGDVVVEVTSPRIPCQTFQSWLDEPQWVRRFTEHGAPGAYLRVLAEGRVRAGATVEVVHRPAHGVTIGEVFQPRFADPARLRRLLEEGEDLQPALVRRLAREVARAAARAAAPTVASSG